MHDFYLINVPNGPYPPVFSSSVVGIHLSVFLSNLTIDRELVRGILEAGANAETVHDTVRIRARMEVMVKENILI